MPDFEKRPAPSVDLKTSVAKPTARFDNLAGGETPATSTGKPLLGPGGGTVSALSAVFSAVFGDEHPAQQRSEPPPGKAPGPAPTPNPAPGPAPTPNQPAGKDAPAPIQPPPPLLLNCPPPGERTPEQQKQIDAALRVAQDKLSYGAFDWQITDKDARTALGALRGLPPELRTVAIDKLDPTSFSRLLSEVPEGERTQFKDLISSCADPARKLQLFAAYHKAHVKGDAAERDGKDGNDPKAKQERAAIVEETEREVDAESAFLLKQVQAGKLTPAQLQQYMSGKESEHQAEMKSGKSQAGTLEGVPDAQRVEYVKERTESLLSYGLTDWKITDAEARKSLQLLTTLPPALQNQAVKSLAPEAFGRFLRELPDDAREQVRPLMDSCDDPALKLQLYGVYHKGQIRSDAAREKEKTADEGSWPGRSSAQAENLRINNRRDTIIETTDQEIDEEVAFLLAQQKDGKPVTMADFDQLVRRKDREHQIEMKYNVNLTNDRGVRSLNTVDGGNVKFAQGQKIVWEEGELAQLESGLARMPREHVIGNPLIREIRRAAMDEQDAQDIGSGLRKEPNVGGDHSSRGNVRIFDAGVFGTYRHTGDSRERADPSLGGLGGPTISAIEETIIHEFGHDMHTQDPDAYKDFQAAAGWQGGKHDPGRIPDPALGSPDEQPLPGAQTQDTWWYARTKPSDHFAETYMKAILVPDKLAHDLLDAPAQRTQNRQSDLQAKQKLLEELEKKDPKPEAAIKKARTDIAQAEAALHEAEQDQAGQEKQFNVMRNQVFHANDATSAAEKRLAEKGVPPEKIREFTAQAKRALTPQQIEQLEAQVTP